MFYTSFLEYDHYQEALQIKTSFNELRTRTNFCGCQQKRQFDQNGEGSGRRGRGGGGGGAGKHQVEEFRHLLFQTLATDLHERRFVMNLEHLDTGLVVLPFIRRCVNWK